MGQSSTHARRISCHTADGFWDLSRRSIASTLTDQLYLKMRATSRLFASVKSGRFLEPNTQTGLTGLLTHPSPRPTLIFVYNSILDKLKALPETSVYRQSTESLTKS